MNLNRFKDRERKDEDLAEEIESHLAHERDANGARGMNAEEAQRQARLKFGNPRTTRESVWRYRSVPWLEDVSRDLRFALRSLLRRQDLRHRGPGDRNWHWREYSRVFGDQHSAAEAAALSRRRGADAADEHHPTGIVSPGRTFRSSISGGSRRAFFSMSRHTTGAVRG